MTNIFSPQEILHIALKSEERGMSLYAVLEEKAEEERLKKMWRYLKEQEEIHKKKFQEMLEGIGDYIVYEFSPGEYDDYLNATASNYIFTQELIEKNIQKPFSSDLEAVEFGISIEKDSILIYTALRNYVLTQKQEILDKIIEEERRHLVELILTKSSLVEKK